MDPPRPGVRLMTMPVADGPDLWTIDVTSDVVNAMLEGFLATGAHVGKVLSWQSRGFGVHRRDTIRITPRG